MLRASCVSRKDWWVPDVLWECVWSFLFLHREGVIENEN